MSLFTTLMVLAVISSVIFFLLTLNRLLLYNKKYHFPELSYTKLFRVIEKKHVIVTHGLFTAVHLVFTIWFIWTL